MDAVKQAERAERAEAVANKAVADVRHLFDRPSFRRLVKLAESAQAEARAARRGRHTAGHATGRASADARGRRPRR
jgi:hypothetical protein